MTLAFKHPEYNKLFDFLHQEANWTPLESEMDDLVSIVKEIILEQNDSKFELLRPLVQDYIITKKAYHDFVVNNSADGDVLRISLHNAECKLLQKCVELFGEN